MSYIRGMYRKAYTGFSNKWNRKHFNKALFLLDLGFTQAYSILNYYQISDFFPTKVPAGKTGSRPTVSFGSILGRIAAIQTK